MPTVTFSGHSDNPSERHEAGCGPELSDEDAQGLNSSSTEAAIRRMIDRMDVSPGVKVILHRIAGITCTWGRHVLAIGRRIIEAIKFFCAKYPKTAKTAIAALFISIMISHIPVLGTLLGPVASAITSALVLTQLVIEATGIEEFVSKHFRPLAAMGAA
jgi:hypothetical protein